MSNTVEKQNEDLQTALDASTETIETLNAELADRPTTEAFEQLQQENADLKAQVDNHEESVADIQALANIGKEALQYAREYALGAYVAFAQCSEDSEEYIEYHAELREDNDYIGMMRAAAGYYRRARNNRARGRQSSSEYPDVPNAQEKPRFKGRSAMGPVSS